MAKKDNNKFLSFYFVVFFGVLVLFTFWFRLSPVSTNLATKITKLLGRKESGKQEVSTLTADTLLEEVAPSGGYNLPIVWGNIGKDLVKSGAISLVKFDKYYGGEKDKDLLSFITDSKDGGIRIDQENAGFWVNTLWALGLVQKSDVLEKGVMKSQYGNELGNFASTGGWTLGTKDAVSLYSSANIIPLTQDEQNKVKSISENIYRPCCGNPTSFPDCNHGMATLGLIEIMVNQGFSEDEIYKAALSFNSYWFTTTYVDLDYYFNKVMGESWDKVDPKVVLSADYSSSQGYQKIKNMIGTVPGSSAAGASCGV